mmetsp:Transcript_3496/g.14150  ORF Transcript_3496/g.14150 Transcript_3496/m.14150 type:complete len:206 (-) Transcript_3496:1231-1848(-)
MAAVSVAVRETTLPCGAEPKAASSCGATLPKGSRCTKSKTRSHNSARQSRACTASTRVDRPFAVTLTSQRRTHCSSRSLRCTRISGSGRVSSGRTARAAAAAADCPCVAQRRPRAPDAAQASRACAVGWPLSRNRRAVAAASAASANSRLARMRGLKKPAVPPGDDASLADTRSSHPPSRTRTVAPAPTPEPVASPTGPSPPSEP